MSSFREILLIVKDISNISADILQIKVKQLAGEYKRITADLLCWLLFVLFAILLGIGGLWLIVYGLHIFLTELVGIIASSMILGGALVLVSVIIFLVARSRLKT